MLGARQTDKERSQENAWGGETPLLHVISNNMVIQFHVDLQPFYTAEHTITNR